MIQVFKSGICVPLEVMALSQHAAQLKEGANRPTKRSTRSVPAAKNATVHQRHLLHHIGG